MKQFMESIVDMGLEQQMAVWSAQDAEYLEYSRETEELEMKYEALDLTKEKRRLINDYVACMHSRDERFAELSYMAGICEAFMLFWKLGIGKEIF